MILLEQLQRALDLKFYGTTNYPLDLNVIPLVGKAGLLIIEKHFEVSDGHSSAMPFMSTVCETTMEHELKLHGWQTTYANEVLGGSYGLLPLEVAN